MSRGVHISVMMHGAVALALWFGDFFDNRPAEIEVADVTLVSEQEFASLATPVVPVPEPAPEPVPEPELMPEQPAFAPAPIPDMPEVSDLPVPPEAPRVAPRPAPPPPPDLPDATIASPAIAPDGEIQIPSEQDPGAAPETTTQIVTDADRPAAPISSPRPRARPTVQPPQETVPEPLPSIADDALNAALSEALASEFQPVDDLALSAEEFSRFRLAVQNCWDVDTGSQAGIVAVTVGFALTPQGMVRDGKVRLVSVSGGDGAAAQVAFERAQRAVLECQLPGGYDLPEEKYEIWKEVEMLFNPEQMF